MNKKILYALALFHLAVLASGMTPLRKNSPEPARRAFSIYEALTGAGGGFGFFSPNVGQQVFVKFEIIDKNGTQKEIALEKMVSREVGIRLGNMFRLFVYSYEKENLRRSLAASFAAHVFESHPDAEQVTFRAYAFVFPSLIQHRDGERTKIEPVYSAAFRRNVK